VTLELLTAPEIYLLRQGPEHVKYGDDWILSAVVEKFGSQATVKGACKLTDKEYLLDIRSIRAEFRGIGIKSARWDRSKAGVFVPHTMEV